MTQVQRPGLLGLFVLAIRIRAYHFLYASPYLVIRLVTQPIRRNGAATTKTDVMFKAIRTMLSHITIAQTRYIYPTTTETYQNLCKQVGLEPNTLHVADQNVTAHWIGEPDAEVVIIFTHGGGYTTPCTQGHVQYFHRLVEEMNATAKQIPNPKSISALLLCHTLVPEAVFPTQLKEVTSLLSHLLNVQKRSPSNIMIAGDSAGGNLALSLLSHLLHPHPKVPRLRLETPLRGVILYSPWVSFSTTWPSFQKNAEKDTLVADMLRKWACMFLGVGTSESDPGEIARGDAWSEALQADASWWSGMHRVVNDVWLWVGADEVFADGLQAFGDRFIEGWKSGGGLERKVERLTEPGSIHIQPIMDVMMQNQKKGESQLQLEDWLRERLKS